MFPKEQVGSDCPMEYTSEILPGIKLYSISLKTSAIIDCSFKVQGLMEKMNTSVDEITLISWFHVRTSHLFSVPCLCNYLDWNSITFFA